MEAAWAGFTPSSSGTFGYHWAVVPASFYPLTSDAMVAGRSTYTWTYVGLAQNASIPSAALNPAVDYRIAVYSGTCAVPLNALVALAAAAVVAWLGQWCSHTHTEALIVVVMSRVVSARESARRLVSNRCVAGVPSRTV